MKKVGLFKKDVNQRSVALPC